MGQRWSRLWPQRVFADPVEVELVAIGLIRTTADDLPQRGHRSVAHLEGWLSGLDAEGRDGSMRVLAEVLACRAAYLVVETCGGDIATAKAKLGQEAADAAEAARLADIPRPAEPTALALTWLGVGALEAAGARSVQVLLDAEHGEWFAGRWDRFVGAGNAGRAHELLLALARIVVASLGCLLEADPARMTAHLDGWAADVFRSGAGVSWWVPDHPGRLSAEDDSTQ
ncbi:hypothetical protein [Peterkaempfera sp. SMS 1(5)a]|uniref:hypothetical protein n=1 Tax=Peterkaempfera podocarpi TaxID=3232308 RepID=UPI00366E16B9